MTGYKSILKQMLSGELPAIPDIGPQRALVQCNENEFVDALTGERLTEDHVESIKKGINTYRLSEYMIRVPEPETIQCEDANQTEIMPQYTKIEDGNGFYYEFLMIGIPEVTKDNRILLTTNE